MRPAWRGIPGAGEGLRRMWGWRCRPPPLERASEQPLQRGGGPDLDHRGPVAENLVPEGSLDDLCRLVTVPADDKCAVNLRMRRTGPYRGGDECRHPLV